VLIHPFLLITSALCFFIGINKYFGRKTALFCILISGALGCFMMGHFCEILFLLVPGEIPEHFHLGILAGIGGYAFLFSASYSQMDGLVDDRSPSLRRYRLLSLGAPALLLAIYLPILFSDLSLAQKIISAALVFCAAFPSYYHLKHLIIPDVSMGIIASIRGYSASALLLEILSVAFLTVNKLEKTTFVWIIGILLAAAYPCVFFSMEKGRKKWTI